MEARLKISPLAHKKYRVQLATGKTIDFGERGASDFTRHKDDERKKRYIARHRKREDWSKSGFDTPGFWARWLLWNEPTLKDSIKDIREKFKITIN